MPLVKALLILLAVIVVVAAYLLAAIGLGIHEYWAGFLFLLQWSMMEEMKVERLPRSALGAALGAAIPFVPVWTAPAIGTGAGLALMLAIILLAVFLLILRTAALLINPATMLFLSVVSIPHIAGHVPPADVFLGLFAGIVFFGGLAGAGVLVQRRAAAKPNTSSAIS